MPHAFVTVVVPFDDEKSDVVNAHLDQLGNLQGGPAAAALDASAFVHFMSLTVVRGSSERPAHLVLEAQADGYPEGVLRRVANTIGDQLRGVLTAAGITLLVTAPKRSSEVAVRPYFTFDSIGVLPRL